MARSRSLPALWLLPLLAGLFVAGCGGRTAYIPARDGRTADAAPPADLQTIESFPPSDTPQRAKDARPNPDRLGGPCPCPSSLVCTLSVCRMPCPGETPCNVPAAGCRPDETCVPLVWITGQAGAACLPGAAPGDSCSATKYCRAGSLCFVNNNSPAKCVSTCATPGTTCGSVGHKCTALPGVGCSLCL